MKAHINHHVLFFFLVLLGVLLSMPCTAHAEKESPWPLDKREKLFITIAERGNAGTVGIYCRHDHAQEAYYGTGAVISRDGYILTSTTVVPEGARDIEVFFTDRRRREAMIVEINEKLETTLIKVDDNTLTPLPISQRQPQTGDRAYTLGNAFHMIRLGEQASFSAGHVSGRYRVKSADNQSSYQGIAIETDAAINPGQDGGPLLDAYGCLSGIISLSFSDLRWQGMAIPVDLIEAGLETFRSGRITPVRDIVVHPPPSDLAEGNILAEHARTIRPALVSIHVERRFPAQVLPRVFLRDYLRSDPRFTESDDRDSRRVMAEIVQADRTLTANRQLRRPPGRVTGFLISDKGHVVTSYFNVMPDTVLTDRKGRLPAIDFKGSLSDILPPAKRRQRRERNQAKAFDVTLSDGRHFPAELVALDQVVGIALLQIVKSSPDEIFPFVSLQDMAADPRLGKKVAVIGVMEEGECDFTFNTGIISVPERNRGHSFQFDALLNYGNSGGPVIDRNGRIVGVATAPMNPGPVIGLILPSEQLTRWPIAPNGGISFGAPTRAVLNAMPSLMAGENTSRMDGPYLGISPRAKDALSETLAIGAVEKGSPADKAGLRRGDRILLIDNETVKSWKELMAILNDSAIGDTLTLRIARSQKKDPIEIEVTLEERP